MLDNCWSNFHLDATVERQWFVWTVCRCFFGGKILVDDRWNFNLHDMYNYIIYIYILRDNAIYIFLFWIIYIQFALSSRFVFPPGQSGELEDIAHRHQSAADLAKIPGAMLNAGRIWAITLTLASQRHRTVTVTVGNLGSCLNPWVCCFAFWFKLRRIMWGYRMMIFWILQMLFLNSGWKFSLPTGIVCAVPQHYSGACIVDGRV